MGTKVRKADGVDPLLAMEQVGQSIGDKRFLAQLAGTKALLAKNDWRGVTIGCRMLYRIAQEGDFLDKVEPVLRPFFESAVAHFEKTRAAMRRLTARLAATSVKMRQVDRLSRLMEASL